MSNFNYMDKVPVKIAESYKPPPRLYQLPQAIFHKLQLPVGYYNEAQQFRYDFQLERKVLAKMPEWRRLRQQERDARRERKEQREQERLLELEAKNKQMLGAVSYPSADDLSSSDSDSDEKKHEGQKSKDSEKSEPDSEAKLILSSQINSFDNILQPTIISRKFENSQTSCILGSDLQPFAKTGKYSNVAKDVNAFNYKDFEEDTSSPFDNIELKTINDLDILAQVLHNTQMHIQQKETVQEDNVKKQSFDNETEKDKEVTKELITKDNTLNIRTGVKNEAENNASLKLEDKPSEFNLEILEKRKTELRNVNFGNLYSQGCYNENIPYAIITNNSITNNSNIPLNTSYSSYSNPQQQSYQMTYGALYGGMGEQQYKNFTAQTHGSSIVSSNRNYLYPPNYSSGTSTYCSPKHLLQTSSIVKSACNAGSYENTISSSNGVHMQTRQQNLSMNSCNDTTLKSKSVPDILAELSDEVRNSEIRRSRYYSFNSEEGKQSGDKNDSDEDPTPKQSPVKKPSSANVNHYDNLPVPAQRLVKNISAMGFPLERVAKVSTIFGTDDKKIIEHLISLSELMDLGFDEMKISDALIQYDNNKEKALEYLIS
ncbi:uncharacterized protein LOC101448830 [Ceratitis capitata]|uniref:(Mediterranean fruit fly) hypothetical protein n=1 Tax=Ceratitis capitata TaxID=7213 RepID=W8BPT0_CERCA|nr:uncharacterized protein LOC101448830 [Ceratitis capitata]CAD6992144.1 unnamed protein product [Ceratitis capitata]